MFTVSNTVTISSGIHVAAIIILQFLLVITYLYLIGLTRATNRSIVRGRSTGIGLILRDMGHLTVYTGPMNGLDY